MPDMPHSFGGAARPVSDFRPFGSPPPAAFGPVGAAIASFAAQEPVGGREPLATTPVSRSAPDEALEFLVFDQAKGELGFRSWSELDEASMAARWQDAAPIKEPHPKDQRHTVYNLTVEDLHTYIAGGYRVHNTSLYWPESVVGRIGGAIGSTIGQLFAGDNIALGLVAGAAGGALGSYLFEQAGGLNKPVDVLGGRLVFNLGSNAASFFGGRAGAELADSLGLPPFGAGLVRTLGSYAAGYAFSYVFSELVGETAAATAVHFASGFTTVAAPTAAPSFASFAVGSLSAIGSFAGSFLAQSILGDDINPKGAQIGGAIGSLAATVAIAAFEIGGPIAAAVAFVATFIGTLFGGLFGGRKKPQPWALTDVEFGRRLDEEAFYRGLTQSQDGGNTALTIGMADNAVDALNSILGAVGGTVMNVGSGPYAYGHSLSRIYTAGGGQLLYFNDAQSALNAGIQGTLNLTQIEGGDIYQKRALAALTSPGSYNVPETTEELRADLGAAAVYGVYADNPYLTDEVIGATGFASRARYEDSLARAEALGITGAFGLYASDTFRRADPDGAYETTVVSRQSRVEVAYVWSGEVNDGYWVPNGFSGYYDDSSISARYFAEPDRDLLVIDKGITRGALTVWQSGLDLHIQASGDANRGGEFYLTVQNWGLERGGVYWEQFDAIRFADGTEYDLGAILGGSGWSGAATTLTATNVTLGADVLTAFNLSPGADALADLALSERLADATPVDGSVGQSVDAQRFWDEGATAAWDLFDVAYLRQEGTAAANVIQAGAGNELLRGGAGDDTYEIARGGGVDLVQDSAFSFETSAHTETTWYQAGQVVPGAWSGQQDDIPEDDYIVNTHTVTGTGNTIVTLVELDAGALDSIVFDSDIAPEDILLGMSGDDLVIAIKDSADPGQPFDEIEDKVIVKDWRNPNRRVEALVFANGVTLSAEDVVRRFVEGVALDAVFAFDLTGNGLELTATNENSVYFDIDRDGYLERVGWVGAEDGLLVLDRNKDGIVNDAGELFSAWTGSYAGNTLPSLAALDTNSDGVVDRTDTGFADLRVWVDLDQDGQTDLGEINALHRFGIESFTLDGEENLAGVTAAITSQVTSGGTIVREATIDQLGQIGTRRGAGFGVVLETAEGGVAYSTSGLTLESGADITVLSLPESGGVVDTALAAGSYIATAKDDTLTSAALAGEATFISGGGGDDILTGSESDDILIGGAGADFLAGGGGDDTIVADDSDDLSNVSGGDGRDLLIFEGDNALGDENTPFELATHGFENLVGGAGDDTISAAAIVERVEISGHLGDDRVVGGAGDDLVSGDDGDDQLDGGAGDDELLGGAGDDRFVGGEGADVIDGGSGYDTIDFSAASSGVSVDLGSGTGGRAPARSGLLDDVSSHFTVSGDAAHEGGASIRLTEAVGGQTGGAMSNARVDLTKDFQIAFDLNFGAIDGADGLAFVLHNDPAGAAALGVGAADFGARYIANGLAIEFDTFANLGRDADIAADHTNLFDTDVTIVNDDFSASRVTDPTTLGELEDGADHRVVVSWVAATQTLSYSVDGTPITARSEDIAALYFGGSQFVHFGWTAGTGGTAHESHVSLQTLNAGFEDGSVVTDFAGATGVVVDGFVEAVATHFTVSGDAALDGANAIRLTEAIAGQTGGAMSNARVDLTKDFQIAFDLNFGAIDGADGLAFVLHNDPAGAAALGVGAADFGARYIANGLAIEFDTFANLGRDADIAADHTNLFDTDVTIVNDDFSASRVTDPTALGELEDGADHRVDVRWNAAAQTLSYWVDGVAIASRTEDLSQLYFGGSQFVHFGWTAGTGGTAHESLVALQVLSATFEDETIVADAGSAASTGNLAVLDNVASHFTVSGDAALDVANTIQLTEAIAGQTGGAMSNQRVDLTKDFQISFDLNFGAIDGADGLAFVLHNDPAGAAALGVGAADFGARYIADGLAIEFDTFANLGRDADISADHTNLFDTDVTIVNDDFSASRVTDPTALGELEDGADHRVVVSWVAATQTLSYSVDGTPIVARSEDIAALYFGGSQFVHFGWTAGTGGTAHESLVRLQTLNASFEDGSVVAETKATTGASDGDQYVSIEQVVGSDHDDFLAGGGAYERFVGGAGADVIDGGGGIDTASYAASNAGVDIDLTRGSQFGGDAEGDVLANIENLVGSDGGDALSGSDSDNVLDGGAGDDTLTGRAGDDLLIGGAGDDALSGGAGVDVYWIGAATGADVIDDSGAAGVPTELSVIAFEAGIGSRDIKTVRDGQDLIVAVLGSGGATARIVRYFDDPSLFSLELADGTAVTPDPVLADSKTGTSGDDVLSSDTAGVFEGYEGQDLIFGSDGADTIRGDRDNSSDANHDDVIVGGAGDDQLYGYGGNDTYVYQRGDGADTVADAWTYSQTHTQQHSNWVEQGEGGYYEYWTTSYTTTTVNNGGLEDALWLGNGIDEDEVLLERSGDDLIVHVLPDIDRQQTDPAFVADTALATGSVTISNHFEASGNSRLEAIVFASGLEWLFARATEDGFVANDLDAHLGTEKDETYAAVSGADPVYRNGYGGNDTIHGGAGDDTLIGGAGDDVIDAGAGDDTLADSDGVNALLGGAGADRYIIAQSGDAGAPAEHTITDTSGADEIVFGYGIAPEHLMLVQDGADLLIGILRDDSRDWETRRETIRIINGLHTTETTRDDHLIEQFTFADGVSFTISQMMRQFGDGREATPDTLLWFGGSLAGPDLGAGDDVADLGPGDDIIFGGDGADILRGNEGYDELHGDGGDDTLYGGVGRDMLVGGVGDDRLEGGIGSDVYFFEQGFGRDSISDVGFTIQNVRGYEKIVYTHTEYGSEYDRVYTTEELVGYDIPTNVELEAGARDAIEFADGISASDIVAEYDPLLNGGTMFIGLKPAGVSVVSIRNLADLIAIENWADVKNRVEVIRFSDGLELDLARIVFGVGDGSLAHSGDAFLAERRDELSQLAPDTGLNYASFTDIESGAYLGTSGADTLSAAPTAVESLVLAGGAGDDTLLGGAGDDLLIGGAGSDVMAGGAGDDTLVADDEDVLSNVSGGVGRDLLIYEGQNAIGAEGGAFDLSAYGFEDMISGAGDDVLFAGASSTGTSISGGAGRDTIEGGDGDDTLSGDAGDDVIDGGAGADILKGGEGADRILGSAGGDVVDGEFGFDTVDYSSSSAAVSVDLAAGAGSGGDAEGDSYASIERVIGSGFADSLSGGDEAETLIGGAGADVIDGGAGEDTVSYESSTLGVDVDLGRSTQLGGDAEGDTLANIENVRGSSADDTLVGTSTANRLEGGAGNDILSGMGGDDVYVFGAATGADIVDDGGSGSAPLGANRIVFEAGIGLRDIKSTRDGQDLLVEVLGGGAASVRVKSYFDSPGQFAFETAQGQSLAISPVTLQSLSGTGADDVMSSDVAGTFSGYDGADLIYGSAGADTIFGDYTNSSAAVFNDVLVGGAGNDALYGYAGDDTYVYHRGDGDDVVYDYLYYQTQTNNPVWIEQGEGGQWHDNYTTHHHYLSGGADMLQFGRGIEADEVVLERSGDDLIVHILADIDRTQPFEYVADTTLATGSVRISSHFATNEVYRLETIAFASGIEWNVQLEVDDGIYRDEITEHLGTEKNETFAAVSDLNSVYRNGQGGDDTIHGGQGGDTLIGGTGNDALYGGSGNDRYHFKAGDGLDVIADGGSLTDFDRVLFDDLTDPHALTLSLVNSGQDLLLSRGADQVTLSGYFATNGSGQIEEVALSDEAHSLVRAATVLMNHAAGFGSQPATLGNLLNYAEENNIPAVTIGNPS